MLTEVAYYCYPDIVHFNDYLKSACQDSISKQNQAEQKSISGIQLFSFMTIDYPSYYDVFEKLQKGTKIQLGIPVSCHLALQSSLTSLYDYNKTATLMRKKGDFLSYKEYYHQYQCINSLLHYSFMESNEEMAKEYNTNYQQLVASTPQQTTKQWQQQGLFVEWKYDGFRIQIHKERDNYYVFGRNGNV